MDDRNPNKNIIIISGYKFRPLFPFWLFPVWGIVVVFTADTVVGVVVVVTFSEVADVEFELFMLLVLLWLLLFPESRLIPPVLGLLKTGWWERSGFVVVSIDGFVEGVTVTFAATVVAASFTVEEVLTAGIAGFAVTLFAGADVVVTFVKTKVVKNTNIKKRFILIKESMVNSEQFLFPKALVKQTAVSPV